MTNKIVRILIVLMISGLNSYSQDSHCREYKTGKFQLIDKEQNLEFVIERNDTIQVERNIKTEEIAKFKIMWLNDCKYELTIIEGKKEFMDFYADKILIIEMIEIYDNGYKFSSKMKGFDYVGYQIVTKIK